MASHYEIRPDQRGLAVRIAQRALRVANGLSTARPGNIFIPNKDENGMSDGTGTWIGSGSVGNGGIAPWVGDKTVPGRPVGISASSSGGVLVASWGGELDGGVPEDFGHVTFFALHDDETVELGRLTVAGSVSSGEYVGGDEVEVWAVAYDLARDPSTGELDPNVSDESDHVTVTVVDLSSEAMDVANAVGQHFWSDDAGVHVSTEEKEAEGESNILMNALGILLRAASNNLVSVTPSGFAVYDETGRVIAQLTGTSSQIGPSNGGNALTTASGLEIRSGTTVLSKFGTDSVILGLNSNSSSISIGGNMATISSSGAWSGTAPGSSMSIKSGSVNVGSHSGFSSINVGYYGDLALNWSNGHKLGGSVMKLLWSGTWTSGTLSIGELPNYNVFAFQVNGSQSPSPPGNAIIFSARANNELVGATGLATGTDTRIVSINLKISGTSLTYSFARYNLLGGETRTNRPIYRIYGVM